VRFHASPTRPVRVQILESGPKLVANPEHLKILQQGVDVWNDWRAKQPTKFASDLGGANLGEADLRGANFNRADLNGARLSDANLSGATFIKADLREASLFRAKLSRADLRWVMLTGANLDWADLRGAIFEGGDLIGASLRKADLRWAILDRTDLGGANLWEADLRKASLIEANLSRSYLVGANLIRANLGGANLWQADLTRADLTRAILVKATLPRADLSEANLSKADLTEADLTGARLVETNLEGAVLSGCRIHGISVWDAKISKATQQQNLTITDRGAPDVTVDNIEVAQFVYLLLHNEKIRDVIDTVGKKGVLLLGRFTEGRIAVLDRLRDELRKRGYLPIVFNFDKPETKDFTETVRLLAGLSKFVIADITNPKSAPLELQATVPEIMVPFRPIIEEGEKPFAMLQDLWIKHREWVFEPIYYSSVDALIASLDEKIVRPAEARFVELLARKAETMRGEHV
jgi:uncharacterized protein YjbI with pentapeptide repeats